VTSVPVNVSELLRRKEEEVEKLRKEMAILEKKLKSGKQEIDTLKSMKKMNTRTQV
jgi:prefoldin subunit 5